MGHTAAIGILTLDPASPLNQRVAASLVLGASDAVLLRFALFADEAAALPRSPTLQHPAHWPTTAVLTRPTYASAARQYACVTKILAWLDFASSSLTCAFIGWVDSDTWFMPQRLQSYLQGVAATLPPGSLSWVGNFMHWQRFDDKLLDGMGFMHGSLPAAEERAMHLALDDSSHKKRLAAHVEALNRSAEERRKLSFPMTQGSFTVFGARAVDVLLRFVKGGSGRGGAAARKFLGAADDPERTRRLPSAPVGKCKLPTDVGIGWLATRAFAGRSDVAVVNMFALLELFVWPSSRFNVRDADDAQESACMSCGRPHARARAG